jgi:hypothetical protein
MAGVEAPLMVAWQACGRDEGGGRRRGAAGGAAWGEGQQGALYGRGPWGTAPVAAWSLFYVRAGRKQEEGERRGKKKKKEKKGKKNLEFFQTWKISEK